RIFGLLQDAAGWPRWNPNFRSATPLAPGPVAVGHRVKLQPADGPEATLELAEMTPGKKLVWKASVMGMTVVTTYTLGDGAPVPVTFDLRIEGGLGALMGGFMKTKAERTLNEGIDALKRTAETPA